MRVVLATLLVAVAVGCADDAPPDDTMRTDTPAPEVELTPGGATEVPPATARHFDPGAIRPGDSFLNLDVVEADVRRVFEDSVWVGRVGFAGEIRVSGVYQRHFDWPEPDALCFHVDDASAGMVPEFAPDTWTSPGMKVWFCFTNPERAQELLGSAETPFHATVVVDDYRVIREFTDAFDIARLVRVDSIGGPARRTLRDP